MSAAGSNGDRTGDELDEGYEDGPERFKVGEHRWLIIASALGLVAVAFVVLLAFAGDPLATSLIIVVVVGLAIIALGTRLRG